MWPSPGGGVFLQNARASCDDDVDIRGNSATRGGGLAAYGSDDDAWAEGCNISSNEAEYGGGIRVYARFVGIELTIEANTASAGGGGVYAGPDGGDGEAADVRLDGGTIVDNAASVGGIAAVKGGTLQFADVEVGAANNPSTIHLYPDDGGSYSAISASGTLNWTCSRPTTSQLGFADFGGDETCGSTLYTCRAQTTEPIDLYDWEDAAVGFGWGATPSVYEANLVTFELVLGDAGFPEQDEIIDLSGPFVDERTGRSMNEYEADAFAGWSHEFFVRWEIAFAVPDGACSSEPEYISVDNVIVSADSRADEDDPVESGYE